MKKNLLFVVSVILLTASIASAQTTQLPVVKQISAGVVNGKAVNLAKPAYPPAARAVNAEGAVNVQVTIDEEGNVVSASAVSGHPLLRQAAEQAALQSKFKPTTLSGQAVRVTGVVVYNFSAAKSSEATISRMKTSEVTMSNWFNVGMMLVTLNKLPTLRYFQPDVVASMIPADWSAEREQLQRLSELKKVELESGFAEKPKERIIDEKVNKSVNNSVTTVTTKTVTVSPDKKNSSEDIAIGQSLINSIRGRLAAETLSLWYFDLGVNFNQALDKADSRSKEERMNSVQLFRQFIQNAPAEIPKEVLEELQKMSSLMEKGVFTDTDKIQLTESLTKINSVIGYQ